MGNILEKDDFQMLEIDGKELTVIGKFDLHELCQENGRPEWVKSGKKSRAVALAGGTWIVKIPAKESGEYIWLRLNVKDNASNLTEFYRGTDGVDGPAKKFAKSGQRTEIPYSLFDRTWRVCDIGTFLVQGTDMDVDNPLMVSGDRLYFVTSKLDLKLSEDDAQWLIYFDARKQEAKGIGGVLSGNRFDPNTDIKSIL